MLFTISVKAQGPKWSTAGNAIGISDKIGSTNNFPLIFTVNNAQKMMLSTSGVLQLNNLSGMGNRFLQTDASGNIIPFAMGTASQVLYGNGTWGSLPSIPASLWSTSGSNIYYTGGKVGIGTSTPATALDVIGDARISNNLYVGGGIIIADKVNANEEVITVKMKADSIVTDSTKGFYGTSKFNGDVKLQSRLSVDGNATVGGDLKTMGSLTFAADKKISYLAASGTTPSLFGWGTPIDIIGPSLPFCFEPTTGMAPTANVFDGMIYAKGVNATGQLNLLRTGFDGANGIIDVAGIGGTTNPSLLLNYYCGMDIYMCTGGGGYVRSGKNFEVGNPLRDANIAVNVDVDEQTGLFVTTSHASDFKYNTKLAVSRDNTKALAVYNNSTSKENFVVYGDGRVSIGTSYKNGGYMLAVNGNIIAQELHVREYAAWPDYVLKPNYKLMPLAELENYFNVHSHFPEMPSESEVNGKGFNASEIITKLLKQQEELALYIIQQNKQLIEQNKRIESLENQVKK